MFVEKWMTPNPYTVRPDASISFVAMEMNRLKFRHFPVAESTRSGPRMVGIVSKYDIARGFPSNLNPFSVEVIEDSVPRPVSTVMTKRLITTPPGCPIEEAARTLRSNRIGALRVLRENKLESESDRLMKRPVEIGGFETQTPYIIVADADALYARAKAAGAAILLDVQPQKRDAQPAYAPRTRRL